MRYSAGHKDEVRAAIVGAAARVFRQVGFDGAGIDSLMAAAGLTRGGFYAHFKSKEALFKEALGHAVQQTRQDLFGKGTPLQDVLDLYLSAYHRDHPALGCPLPSLSADMARAPARVKRSFQDAVESMLSAVHDAGKGKPGVTGDKAMAVLALSVGGVVLSRAVHDAALGDRILDSCRKAVHQLIKC